MTNTNKIFDLAQLAEASYADFAKFSPKAALISNGSSFSDAQANAFLTHWRVISHQPDTARGLSSTLFQHIQMVAA